MKQTISIRAGELKSALTGLAKIIDPRSPNEVCRSVMVESNNGVSLLGTDTTTFVRVSIEGEPSHNARRYLVPFAKLRDFTRRLPTHAIVHIGENLLQSEQGTARSEERFDKIDPAQFPEEPEIKAMPQELPALFSVLFREALGCASKESHRPTLQGVYLDVDSEHHLVATDGRHLYQSKALTLPITESLIVPSLSIFSWSGLGDEWKIAVERKNEVQRFSVHSGNWRITSQAVEGTYPNWKAVIPETSATLLTLPPEHGFKEVFGFFSKETNRDNSALVLVENGDVNLIAGDGSFLAALPGVLTTGPDITITLNRDYLIKAFDYGFLTIGLNDPASAILFRNERALMVVMPMRTEPGDKKQLPPQTQPTNTNMTAIQPQGDNEPHTNGNPVSTATKPALEAAIDNLDSFRANLREALSGISAITSLLRQAIRDQRLNEREIQSVRQTLRSLQGVRI
jgi:DNA polymerase III sliding clamp (beta) subunit (PCNA family)